MSRRGRQDRQQEGLGLTGRRRDAGARGAAGAYTGRTNSLPTPTPTMTGLDRLATLPDADFITLWPAAGAIDEVVGRPGAC